MILAGDVGGTKSNLALMRRGDGGALEALHERTYVSREFDGLAPLVERFLADVEYSGEREAIEAACFGIAGPVVNQRVEAPNLAWVIEADAVERALSVGHVVLLNDLEATGWGIGTLGEDQLVTLNAGEPHPEANGALIAAGTGLGEALLMRDPAAGAGGFRPVAGEGGHCDFAPRNEREIGLLKFLLPIFGRVSYERVVSGPGIYNIYQYLRQRGDHGDEPATLAEAIASGDPSAAIGAAGIDDEVYLARRTLELFVELYGAEAGNLALTVMALGGVYVGGGVAPRLRELVEGGAFMNGFCAKGRFAEIAAKMPVYLILEPKTALYGAARRAEFAASAR